MMHYVPDYIRVQEAHLVTTFTNIISHLTFSSTSPALKWTSLPSHSSTVMYWSQLLPRQRHPLSLRALSPFHLQRGQIRTTPANAWTTFPSLASLNMVAASSMDWNMMGRRQGIRSVTCQGPRQRQRRIIKRQGVENTVAETEGGGSCNQPISAGSATVSLTECASVCVFGICATVCVTISISF